MAGSLHMAVSKGWLIGVIENRKDWRDFIPGFSGTRDEAVTLLEEDSREFFLGDNCDNQKPNGECAGHTEASYATR